jgi:hypothetical protein
MALNLKFVKLVDPALKLRVFSSGVFGNDPNAGEAARATFERHEGNGQRKLPSNVWQGQLPTVDLARLFNEENDVNGQCRP